MPTFTLQGFSFEELQTFSGLEKLDQLFLTYLQSKTPELATFVVDYRQKKLSLLNKDLSNTLIELAKCMETFIANLYTITDDVERLHCDTLQYNPIFAFKKEFVLKRAKRELRKEHPSVDYSKLTADLFQKAASDKDPELALARYAMEKLAHNDTADVDAITLWCVLSLKNPTELTQNWSSFKIPERLDFQHLIAMDLADNGASLKKQLQTQHFTQRDNFELCDNRMSAKQIQNEVNYCVYCHEKDDDFCSRGFPESKHNPDFKKNPLGVTLAGCPLDEKISEMNTLKRDGFSIAALAMVMRDNPMCPATGHRICNDCMKACIYQKQDPVNIPEIETRVLTDVLSLPWGVEIYDLLARWNPLRQEQFLPKPANDYKVLIAGLGPAGFTMAYHLLMEGCSVVGFDGLKLEPLPEKYVKQPIKHYQDITESLDKRVMTGFGGVAEYGITVRWDKNFLKLIYLTLMRRQQFQLFGNVRFGGTVTVEDAKALGFDHLCIAVGAGLPKAIPIPGSLAPGMRQANDFLMSLQLTGALKKESLANLQIRMPILVIGGGLTGVDAATEAQVYYIRQVEKTLERYQAICQLHTEQTTRENFSTLELEALDEHLQHARLIQAERILAATENRTPDFIKLMHSWGGVSIVYRRRMQESPAYISNHEELQKALEQGIFYIENAWPVATQLDENGHCSGLAVKIRHHDTDGHWDVHNGDTETVVPAKTILVATGASLNIAYSFEHKDTFVKKDGHYTPHEWVDGALEPIAVTEHCKSTHFGPFTSYNQDNFYVSYIGDSHPAFHGNVVKAIASAKQSYPKVMAVIKQINPVNQDGNFGEFIKDYFEATVTQVEKIADDIVRLTIRCKAAITHFKPGHFFRLQNYESQHKLLSEAIPLAATQVNREQSTLTFTVINYGVSSQICQRFKVGDPVALMGPTGVKSKVHEHEKILVIGNALAGIQAQVLQHYCEDQHAQLTLLTDDKTLPHDKNVNVIYSDNCIAHLNTLNLTQYHRILIVGNHAFMTAFEAYKLHYTDRFKADTKIFAASYAPMQCMLKGVCAQCLVWQKNPETGQHKKAVYACSWQHQPLELIDLDNLADRLSQNSMQEKLTGMWFKLSLYTQRS